ncbi:hypothetical protein [Rheinheimera fenheensis]|uniref:hypothetical protein n=1 Tax=Rheinheimera fenheensis TaxID=3152295 RepID=UPI00325DB61E
METSSKLTLANISMFIGLSVAVLVPALYLMGYLYQSGYLSYYQLPVDSFPRSFENYLVLSFFVMVKFYAIVTEYFGRYVLVIFLGVLFFLTVGITFKKLNKKYSDKLDRLKLRLLQSEHADFIVIAPLAAAMSVVTPIIAWTCISLFILVEVQSFNIGRDTAANEIEQFVPCDQVNSKCITAVKGDKRVSGLLVAFSERHIALYDGEVTHILPNDGMSYLTKPVNN